MSAPKPPAQGDRFEESILRSADRARPRLRTSPPTLASLEWRARRRTAGAAALLAAAGLLAFSLPQWLRAQDPDTAREADAAFGLASAPEAAAGSVERATRAVDAQLRAAASSAASPAGGALGPSRAAGAPLRPAVSPRVERALIESFRALHRSAENGDIDALDDLAGLAARYPTTDAAACARLYLAELGGSVDSSANPKRR